MLRKMFQKLFGLIFLRNTEMIFNTLPYQQIFEFRLQGDLENRLHGNTDIREVKIVQRNGYYELSGLSFVYGSEKVKQFGLAINKHDFLAGYKYQWHHVNGLVEDLRDRLITEWKKEGIDLDAR